MKLAIDLGNSNTLVYVENRGVVINEPSIVAIHKSEIIAIGNEARDMLGRTPKNIKALNPIKNGVIADYAVTEIMINYFINKALGKFRLFRPSIVVTVPTGITSTEKRAVVDAVRNAGAKEVHLISSPLAAAIGTELPIHEPNGHLIVDIGGGTTEVAVLSLGGIVVHNSTRIGGDNIDYSITSYIRANYNLSIGPSTAEEIKFKIASAMYRDDTKFITIKGRDLVEGLPKSITINSTEITESIHDPLESIIEAIRDVLEKTPPELSADITLNKIMLCGGSANLHNLDKLIASKTELPVYICPDPSFAIIKGAGIVACNLSKYLRNLES